MSISAQDKLSMMFGGIAKKTAVKQEDEIKKNEAINNDISSQKVNTADKEDNKEISENAAKKDTAQTENNEIVNEADSKIDGNINEEIQTENSSGIEKNTDEENEEDNDEENDNDNAENKESDNTDSEENKTEENADGPISFLAKLGMADPKKEAAKKKGSTNTASSKPKEVKEEEYKGPREVRLEGGRTLFIENDPKVTLEDIRKRLVSEFKMNEFSKERTFMSFDATTGIIVPKISHQKKG